RELAGALDAASACLTLTADAARTSIVARLAPELLAVEVQRAARLARAATLVTAVPALSVRDLLLSALVHDVVTATEPMRRLLGAAARIVEAHGGQLEWRPPTHAECTVRLTLPRR